MLAARFYFNRAPRFLAPAARFHTSSPVANSAIKPNEIAFVFDIDGVLVRGGGALPPAKPTLELLQKHNVPFMLLTNGGGVTEASRTDYLSKEIGFPINPIQIVQSHTPFKTLASIYDRVMIIGGPENHAKEVALSYGFKDVWTPVDVIAGLGRPVWPFHKYTDEQVQKWGSRGLKEGKAGLQSKPFDAVFVFNDVRDMASDIQVIMDLLLSENGKIGTLRDVKKVKDLTKPSVPFYISNNDLLWANEYPLPRFALGAFRMTIERLYKELNHGADLDLTIIGKPNVLTYDYVHNALIDWRNKILKDPTIANQKGLSQVVPKLGQSPTNSPFKKIYMIGDNPASDIQGANNYGWESCLVRTGVYKDSDTLTVKPTYIVDNCYEAIKTALKANNII